MDQLTQEEILRQAMKEQSVFAAYAYGMLRDWALAQDVVQEAFVVVSMKWQTFQAGASVRAWVRGIVRLKTYEILRSRGQEKYMENEALLKVIEQRCDEYCEEVQPEDLERRTAALARCMERLSPRNHDMLVKFYWNEESCRQLSDVSGRTINALRLQLSRLRQQLRLCVVRRLNAEHA